MGWPWAGAGVGASAQAARLGQVGRHVAVGRVDDDGADRGHHVADHHAARGLVVQHDVARRVARRVEHAPRADQLIALGQLAVDLHLAGQELGRAAVGGDGQAGLGREPGRGAHVIGVVVGQRDPHRARLAHGREQGRARVGVRRRRIDHPAVDEDGVGEQVAGKERRRAQQRQGPGHGIRRL
ncbi:MAG: hypothetical protein U1F43_33010 [Myxococcota bacterium]